MNTCYDWSFFSLLLPSFLHRRRRRFFIGCRYYFTSRYRAYIYRLFLALCGLISGSFSTACFVFLYWFFFCSFLLRFLLPFVRNFVIQYDFFAVFNPSEVCFKFLHIAGEFEENRVQGNRTTTNSFEIAFFFSCHRANKVRPVWNFKIWEEKNKLMEWGKWRQYGN